MKEYTGAFLLAIMAGIKEAQGHDISASILLLATVVAISHVSKSKGDK